jgi:ubiquinone/menaquinone biosynthesis C-methylase UbiE
MDKPVEHENLDEFADAENYDDANADAEGEAGKAFYLAQAAAIGGPVLDVACGTGRVAIPMAAQGLAVTGLDIVPGMLDVARRKAGNLPIRWIEGDARDFDLGERFRFIFMTGNAFQAFVTRAEQEAVLRCVHRHLAEGGVFAFEVRNPRWARATNSPDAVGQQAARYEHRGGFYANLESDPVEREAEGFVDRAGNRVVFYESQAWDHAAQILHIDSWRVWNVEGEEHRRRSRTALRYTFPQEMRMLLEYNGFAIEEQYGDWDRSALTAESFNLITLCARND